MTARLAPFRNNTRTSVTAQSSRLHALHAVSYDLDRLVSVYVVKPVKFLGGNFFAFLWSALAHAYRSAFIRILFW